MPTLEQILNRGWDLHQDGRIDDAKQVYQLVLDKVPDCPEAMVFLGIAFFDERRFTESERMYRQALAINGDFPIAWNNLGNTLRLMGRVADAEACFAKAINQDPKYVSAYINRGTLWVWTGEIDRGLMHYQQGLALQRDHAELHRNIGVIELLRGNFDIGWPEYRWRWTMPGVYRPKSTAPIWSGEPIQGKSILLYPEQGRGDAIQFVRVATVLRDAGAIVYLECRANMMPIFSSVEGIAQLVTRGDVPPTTDFQASLIDVVDVWHTIHGQMPYAITDANGPAYLSVSTELVQYWHDWFSEHCPVEDDVKRIGINWQGNREHHADVYRSLPLAEYAPFAALPNIQLINLQFGDGVEQIHDVDFGEKIFRLPNDLDGDGGAFTDTTAILHELDAVVTSDTALAHLSGAVGVPTHVLLGKVPDWRWLQQGSTTPWYPSMRLYRQETLGNWRDVINEIVAVLQT